MPLGGIANFPYKQQEAVLFPGDVILFMSDGFPELFNENNELLDYPRVKEFFKETAEKTAEDIVNHLISAGDNWRQSRQQDDDITFVVLKVIA